MLDRKLADAVRGADHQEDQTGYLIGKQLPADMKEVKKLIDAGADLEKCN